MHSRILGLLALTLVGPWAAAQAPNMNNTPAPTPTVVTPPGVNILNGAPPVPSLTAPPTGQPVLAAESALGPTTNGPIFYSKAEYLLWKVQDGVIPSTARTIPSGVTSILGTSNEIADSDRFNTIIYSTTSISSQANFGFGSTSDSGVQSGSRIYAGLWFDSDMSFGLEGVFLFLAQGGDQFRGQASLSNSQFILNFGTTVNYLVDGQGRLVPRPTDNQTVRQLNSTVVGSTASAMWGGEINTRCMAFRIGGCDVGTIAGFRYLGLKDELQLVNSISLRDPNTFTGRPVGFGEPTVSLSTDLNIRTFDRTRIWNQFYGGQVGMDFDYNFGSLFIYSRFKIGAGTIRQVADVSSFTSTINNEPERTVEINGQRTSFQTTPPSSTSPGGLLSAPGDNGRHERNVFSFVPEINLKVGYYVTDWFKIHAGYDWLWMTNVARAGASVTQTTLQTNVNVGNTNETINVTAPAFRFQNNDVWIQGVNFGLEFIF